MDFTLVALLAFLVLAALWGPADMQGIDLNYVSNGSSETIVATISYNGGLGTSRFNDRVIVPGDSQSDRHLAFLNGVRVELWVQGSCCHAFVYIASGASIVGLDSGDGGVDIFLAKDLTQFQPIYQSIANIYPEIYFQPNGQPVANNSCTILDCLA